MLHQTPVKQRLQVHVHLRVGFRLAESRRASPDCPPSGIGIGETECQRIGVVLQGCKESLCLRRGIVLKGHRMKRHNQGRGIEIHVDLLLQFLLREEIRPAQKIKRWSADVVNTPGLLAHLHDPACRSLGRGKMQVRHRGQGVTHDLIDRTLAALAPLDMRDRNPHGHRGGCGREHFIPIRDEQQQVRTADLEPLSERQHRQAQCLGHADIRVGTHQALDTIMNLKTVLLYHIDGVAELRREMTAHHHQTHPHPRKFRQLLEHPVQMPVISPGGSDDGNGSHGRLNPDLSCEA